MTRLPRWLALPLFFGLAGLAVAKPKPTAKATKLDPVWAKQLVPSVAKALSTSPIEASPSFATVRKMKLADKAAALGTEPEAVQGPLHLSARAPFIDAKHHLELRSHGGMLNVRAAAGYAYFVPPNDLQDQPRATVHFLAEPNRRYLLECIVDTSGSVYQEVGASDGARYYSTRVNHEGSSLMYRLEATASQREIVVEIAGTTAVPWYLEGCELSWGPP